MNSEIQLEATASKFDRDLRNIGENWSKYTGPAVRCGFEAEFASSLNHYDFADKLHTVLGINRSSITVNPTYGASHNGDYRYWSVESDSTIRTWGEYTHKIELVAPIMGLDAMLSSMSAVFGMLEDVGHTDSSTGLHMTFSLTDVDLSKINVAKLALLLGEEYWAEAFDRTDTTYAVAVTPLIQEFIESEGSRALLASRSLDVDAFMSNLSTDERRHAINATKILGVNKDKQCIELRLPGGPDYHKKFSLCSRLARRFAYALYASTCDAYNDVFALKVLRIANKYMEQVKQDFGDAISVRIAEAPSGYRIFTKRGDGRHEPFVEITVFGGSVSRIGLSPKTIEPISDNAAYFIEQFANKISLSGMTVHGKTVRLSWKDADAIDWRTLGAKFQRIRPAIALLQLCGISSKTDVAQYILHCAEHGRHSSVAHLVDPLGYMYDSNNEADYATNAGLWVGRVIRNGDSSDIRRAVESSIGGSRSLKFCAGAGILPGKQVNASYLTTLADLLANGDNYQVNDPDLVPTLIILALDSISDAKMCLDIMAETHSNALHDVDSIVYGFNRLLPTVGRSFLDMSITVNSHVGFGLSTIANLICCKQDAKLRTALTSSLIHALQGVGYSRGNGTNLLGLPLSDAELNQLGVTEIPELIPAGSDEGHIIDVVNNLTGEDDELEVDKCSRDSIRRALDNTKLLAYLQEPNVLRDIDTISSVLGHWLDAAGWDSPQPNMLNLMKSNAHFANDFLRKAMQPEMYQDIDKMNYADVVAILRTAIHKGQADFNELVGAEVDGLVNLEQYVRSALSGDSSRRVSIHVSRALMNDLASDVLSAWLGSGRIKQSDIVASSYSGLGMMCHELETCKEKGLPIDNHYVFVDLVMAMQREALTGTPDAYQLSSDRNRLAELRIEVRDVPAPKPAHISTYAPAADNHSLGESTRPDSFVAKPLPLEDIIKSLDDSTFFAVIPDDGVSTQETAEAKQAEITAAIDAASEQDVRAVFEHVESGPLSPAMRKLFYISIVFSGVSGELTNPSVYTVGLNYPMFVDNVFRNITGYDSTKKITSIFGYSLKDAFYLLLVQTTAPLSRPINVNAYLSALGKFTPAVTPDVMFSARSVLYFKKLLAASMLHSFDRTNAKASVLELANGLNRAYAELKQNRNYPLLLALAKYAGMTRSQYAETFRRITSND